ncbi:MAG TPA: Gfo/Idh/MocA family oxidoreductase [Dongiaceae bacterium]|nr:Gfo/Idh/MocA family oxidoreductase [Dongiaceae bacterium]
MPKTFFLPTPGAGVSRRNFIKSSSLVAAALASGIPLVGCSTTPRGRRVSANDKINIAVVGAGGKGSSDTDHCSNENIVALCDADERNSMGQRKKYPKAKFYRDYRQMLAEMDKSIDAVIVATPDNMHAVATSMAMKMGKHVYCQKPLTYTVAESRYLRGLAKHGRVVTQMGNQGSAEDGLRRAVECIQAGVIGQVKQVFVWSNRPVWPQGMGRPDGSDPVPAELDWNQWIGPAAERPFKEHIYEPFNWRGWVDFGCGALGDMACHTANMPFRALKLGYPTQVEAESSGMNGESFPLWSKIRFEFPARGSMGPVTLWWYDGGKPEPDHPFRHDGSNKPPREITAEVEELLGEVPGSGCVLIGDKGQIFSDDDYGARFFIKLNGDKKYKVYSNKVSGKMVEHEAIRDIPITLPRNPFKGDTDYRHHQEWLAAIRGGPVPYSNFNIAAYLTEIILLGCVALRTGQRLDWDGPNMRATNCPDADHFIHRVYRDGFQLS